MHLGKFALGLFAVLTPLLLATMRTGSPFQRIHLLSESLRVLKAASIGNHRQHFDAQINTNNRPSCRHRFSLFLMHTDGHVPSPSFFSDGRTPNLDIHRQVAVLFEAKQAHTWQLDRIRVDMDNPRETRTAKGFLLALEARVPTFAFVLALFL